MKFGRVLLVALMAMAIPRPGLAQNPADLVGQGIRAYEDLDYGAAVGFLRRALAPAFEGGLEVSERIDAFSYLAAIEVFRGNPGSAAVAFRELLLFDPRYRLDRLIFPPEVWDVFERVRSRTKAVTVQIPRESEISVGNGELAAQVFASSSHDVTAEILRSGGGGVVATLYSGPIGDSLEIRWDPRDAAGQPVASGTYVLSVTSRDSTRRVTRRYRIPLEVEVLRSDTLPRPPVPDSSLYLPERRAPRPRIEALAGGVLAGVAVVLLPPTLAPGSNLTDARFAVAGVVSIAGVLGFFKRPPGAPIPQNLEANRTIRQAWQDRLQAVQRENARRRADVRVFVRSGVPTVSGSEDP